MIFFLFPSIEYSAITYMYKYVSAAQVAPKWKAQGVKSNVYTITFYV